VQVIRSLLAQQPFKPEALSSEVEHEASESVIRYYLRVLDASGAIQFETPGMKSLLAPSAFPPPAKVAAGGAEDFLRDRNYLLATATSTDTQDHVIQAALDTSDDAALLADYGLRLLGVLGMGLVFAAATGGVAAWAGMRPLIRVAEVARRISASQLHERIVVANWPAELMDLAQAMNAMFDRLQDSFSRLTQLSGDLAHELRTPISNLRGEAEVALKRCRTVEEYQQVLGSSLEECERLSRMIDGLLFVARRRPAHRRRKILRRPREIRPSGVLMPWRVNRVTVGAGFHCHPR
jgi:two-component system heavy metal sensor histidine kinase CusS